MPNERFSFETAEEIPTWRGGLYDEIIDAFIEQDNNIVIVHVKESIDVDNMAQGLRNCIKRRKLSNKINCARRARTLYLEKLEVEG